jgi:DNA-binding transcriptional MerR regulator/methylmalonyl-CoA mutase cobalamin-binding subunit
MENMSGSDNSSWNEPRHPIRVVARRTGLKPDLIRAWERRYGAVSPGRSSTRRRFYSDAEVDRLSRLARVVRAGHAISQVAPLPDEELQRLLDQDSPAPTLSPGASRTEAVLAACLAAVQRLDARGLELELDRAVVEIGMTEILDEVLAPLMRRIGDQWKEGTLRPFHEHAASAVVRSFLGGGWREPAPGAPVLIAATPARQRHELGAMLAAACAAAEGWQVVYLGPDLPPEEIAAASLHQGARAVALSLVYPPDDALLRDDLRRLRRLLDPRTDLIVGGRAAFAYADVLDETRAITLDDLRLLRHRLEDLRARSWVPEPSTPNLDNTRAL